jgi:hypothetical protein
MRMYRSGCHRPVYAQDVNDVRVVQLSDGSLTLSPSELCASGWLRVDAAGLFKPSGDFQLALQPRVQMCLVRVSNHSGIHGNLSSL